MPVEHHVGPVPTIKEQEIYKKQKVTGVILNTTGTKNPAWL